MVLSDKIEIIRALFAAYLSNDRKAVEASFTDDFRFTSPYDDEIDKATYFDRCFPEVTNFVLTISSSFLSKVTKLLSVIKPN